MRPTTISENINFIRNQINLTCSEFNRNPKEVTLIAVSKKKPIELIIEAVNCGIIDIGENYAQELRDKNLIINNSDIRWHFIGNLQRNKVKYIAPGSFMVHTVDSISLANELNNHSGNLGKILQVLIQVNTSGEGTKSGVPPEDALNLATEIQGYSNIVLKGLMTIPKEHEDLEKVRPYFKMLKEIKNDISNNLGIELPHLSMGMTQDFRVAIEEGATLIRIGTAIFSDR